MFSVFLRLLAAFLITLPVHFLTVPQVGAQNPIDARINLAGRQRMLTQRMAKASCFVMIGVAPHEHATESKTAADEFAKALTVLRLGDAPLGYEAENNPAVIEALTEAQVLWATYGPAIRQIYSQDRHNVVVDQFLRLNLKILGQMNDIVGLIELHHADPAKRDTRAATVNIAGRQRMLSQKMAKEMCLIFAGIQTDTHKEMLLGSMGQFDATLEALTKGDVERGIVTPPNDQAREALEAMKRAWMTLRPVIVRAANGGVLSAADMGRVADHTDVLLRAAHRTVLAYL